MDRTHLLAVARGDKPADLLLRGGLVVNVFSGAIESAEIAIVGGLIAGVGTGYEGRTVVDLDGAYVAPGLIDAHVHIESSLCIPAQFAQAVVPHGVTTVVTDPHEIANVAGLAGVRFMAQSSVGLPLDVVVLASSCVPATHMETSGATLAAAELAQLLAEGTVHGLAEVMNFPGVVNGDPEVLAKIAAFEGRPRDGHAPALSGKLLNAYVASGIGSEHECTTVEEAREKLARGLYILIREATNAHNLHTLLPMIDKHNSRRLCFCTDDRIPSDLIDQGTIDYMVREAIRFGIAPITALCMATLNTAEWFGLHDRGAIAPGRRADLIVFDDLADLRPRLVFAGGQLAAENGAMRAATDGEAVAIPAAVGSTVDIRWDTVDLRIPAAGRRMRVIGSLLNQLVTEERILPAVNVDGFAVADPAQDVLKMAVIERHKGSGALGLGFIQGIGLRRGAMAGTVAHDHHNLVVIGADDASMMAAARAVAKMGGGLAVADGEEICATLPLPVAGLMSNRPIDEVRRGYDALIAAAQALGSPLHDPFMAMSFMALEVIPKLKLTDQGLVDVEQFKIVPIFVD
ncbi:MAG: adenine deaminase [Caldilinea sp.]